MNNQEEIKFKISDLSPISFSDIDKNDLLLITDVSEIDKSKLSKSLSIEKLSNYINNKTPVVTVDLLLSTGVHIADIIANNSRYSLYAPQSTYSEGIGISIDDSTGKISINPEVLNEINTIESNLNIINTNLSNSISTLRSDIYRDMKVETSKLDVDTYEGIGKFVTSVTQLDGLISVNKGIIEIDDLPELNIDNINNLTTRLNSLDSSVININNTISNYVFKSTPSDSNKILTELDISSFTSGVNYLGESTSEITDGGIESPTIDGDTIDPNEGYVAKYNNDLFIFHNNKWINLTKDVARKGEIVDSYISDSANINISKINGLSNLLNNIDNSINNLSESLSLDISNLLNKVNNNELSINQLNTAVEVNTSNISTNASNISSNTSDILLLNNSVNKNTNDITDLSNNYTNLNTIVNTHTNQIQNIINSSFNILINESDLNGYINVNESDLKVYNLPMADDSVLGGIKVGSGLSIDDAGVLSVNNIGINVVDESEGNGISNLEYINNELVITRSEFAESIHTHDLVTPFNSGFLSDSDYIRFVNGLNTPVSKSDINGNIIIGDTDITIYSLPTASDLIKGGIRIGDNLTVDENNILTVNDVTTVSNGLMIASDKVKLDNLTKVTQSSINGNIKLDNNEVTIYNLPVASSEILGGIKVGENLRINNGVLSGNYIGSNTIQLFANEINLKLNGDDKLLYEDNQGLHTDINLVYDRLEGIKLLGKDNIQIGDTIDPSLFVTNGILESVELVNDPIGYLEGQYIKLGFYINDFDSSSSGDDISYIYININDFIRIYSSSNSIQINSDSSIDVKLRDSSGLTIDSNGLGLHPVIINGLDEMANSIRSKVTGYDSAVEDHVVVFGGDGYSVKDSGFTLGKSVPSDAKFTDTTYGIVTTTTNGLMSSSDKYKLDKLNVNELLNTISTLQYNLSNLTERFNKYIINDRAIRYKELIISDESSDNKYFTNEVNVSNDIDYVTLSINDGLLSRDNYLFNMELNEEYELPEINLYVKYSEDEEFIEVSGVIKPKRIIYSIVDEDEELNYYQYIDVILLDHSLLKPGCTFYLSFNKSEGNGNKLFLQEYYYNS